MNHDPFDTLRSRNPAPRESLPDAPMAVASRITAGRPSLRRGLAIAAVTAGVVLVAGGGWLIWSQAGGGGEVVGPATTTTEAATTTSGATTTTMGTVADEVPELVVYFLRDGALMPVARDLRVLNVRPLPDPGPLALDLLLWGPGAWDAAPLPDPVAAAEAELTTAIPEGTKVLALGFADGVATADLSAEFADASPQAIAQVVYSLTGPYLNAEEVRFLIAGVPQVVGSLTSGLFTPYLEPAAAGVGMETVGREILSLFVPDVMIESPALGGTLRPGQAVTLITRGDDATLTLTAADGTLLWNAWAPSGGEPSYLPPEVIEAAGGYGVWATLQAQATVGDGAVIVVAQIPVWLEPDVPFTNEPEIPEATTTTFGLGAMRPFPDGMLTGCAVATARDLASFEAALANGPLSLLDLCAVVGIPDGEVGSGLFIPVYELADGSRLYLGYTAPWGDGLLYANLVAPDGTVRRLLLP